MNKKQIIIGFFIILAVVAIAGLLVYFLIRPVPKEVQPASNLAASAVMSFDIPVAAANAAATTEQKPKQYLISTDEKGNLTNTTLECTDGNAVVNGNANINGNVNVSGNIHITGNTTFTGNTVIPKITGKISYIDNTDEYIQTPDSTLRINSKGIIFGGPNNTTGRELNSGQISTLHDNNALCLVGVGNSGQARRVKIWENLEVAGTLCVGGVCINSEHLKILTGEKRIGLESPRGTYMSTQKGSGDSWMQLRPYGGDWEQWILRMK